MDETIERLIEDDDLRGLKAKLKADPSLASGPKGYTHPIHWAAGNGRDAAIEVLLKHGADVNAIDQVGRTALHRAAKLHPKAVRVLLDHGANLDIVDSQGFTPLTWAVYGQQPEGERVVKLLRKAGAAYDLGAAVALGDLVGVRRVLRDDPDAARKHTLPEFLPMICLAVQEPGTPEDRLEILRLLFAHGLNVPRDKLKQFAKEAEFFGLAEEAQLLRGQARRKSDG